MQLGSLQDICQLYNKYSLELGSVIDDWIIRTSIPFNNQRTAKGGKKGNRWYNNYSYQLLLLLLLLLLNSVHAKKIA